MKAIKETQKHPIYKRYLQDDDLQQHKHIEAVNVNKAHSIITPIIT